MNQRISGLMPLNAGSFNPNTTWLEVIVVDLSSATGFTTVRVRADAVGGSAVGLNQIAFGDASTGALTSDMSFYRNPSTGDITMGSFYFNSSGSYPYLAMDEMAPDLSNYTILRAAGTTSINGTASQPITFKKSNADLIRMYQPSTNVPLLDFNNVVSNQAVKIYDKYSIGLASNKLLLNTDTSGAVSIGRYDGTTHYPYFVLDNATGIFKTDNIQSLSGGTIAVIGGTNLAWGSGGGLVNAALTSCYSNYSDIHFGNNYGIEGAGRIAIGDNTYMSTYAGGVANYLRFTRLSGNSTLDLQKITAPTDGGFMFVQAFPYTQDRLAYVGKNDKFQMFCDHGWTMPIGGSYKGQLDCTKTFSVSATYDDTEIAAIVNDYSDTKRILAAVLQFLGNKVESPGFNDTLNQLFLPAHNLVGRQRVRFISDQADTLPAEIIQGTWYFVCDTPVDVDNFQITTSIGGTALDFSNPTGGYDAYMEIEFSGMSLLNS